MTHKPSILLVAQPGHLRDSLQVLLTALSGGRQVVLASSWLAETLGAENSHHDLILVVLETGTPITEVSAGIAKIKSHRPQTQLVVLVDTEQERQAATSSGADRVWFKGTLAAQMLVEIEMLLNE